MKMMVTRTRLVLGAAALVTLILVPVQPAAGAGGPQATASGVKKTVKKLKQQVEQLQQQVDALTLQPGPEGPQGPVGPQGPAGSFTGTAGGDLTGTYPNPVLRAGAVAGGTGGEISDNTITNADIAGSAQFSGAAAGGDLTGTYPTPTIAANAVGSAEIASGAVGSAEIANGGVAQQDLAPDAFGARAYGRVAADGSLSRSKNVVLVYQSSTGVYCIAADVTDRSNAVLIPSPDFRDGGVDVSFADFALAMSDSTGSGSGCSAGELVVRTFAYNGDFSADGVGGDFIAPNSKPFSFVVP